MCTRLKVSTSIIKPGAILAYKTLSAIKQGAFGFQDGSYNIVNAREDNLMHHWKKYLENRGVIEAETFEEKGTNFGIIGQSMHIPIIYAPSGNFAIVTTDSVGVVKQVHHRMPCVIQDDDTWLRKGIIVHAEYLVQLRAA